MIIDLKHWNKIWRFIENKHWKVASGMVFWFSTQVAGFDWEYKVIEILKKIKIEKYNSKVCSMKVFGFISKFFKKIRDCSVLYNFDSNFIKL